MDRNTGGIYTMIMLMMVVLEFFFTSTVYGHVSLTFPPARRLALDFLDSARTKGPCGMPRGDIKTSLLSGSKFNATWHLGYPHRGGFKLQLLDELERPVLDLTPTIQGSEYLSTDTTAQNFLVQLPSDFVCTNCTLRLLRQAVEWGNDYKFWSCADVEIKLRKDFRETCSGHGRYLLGRCKCDRLYHGTFCESKEECSEDSDCGPHGKCIDTEATTMPRHQCYCQMGWFGTTCNRRSTVKNYNNLDLDAYKKRQLSPTFQLYYRILKDYNEIEVVLIVNGTSYVALGWRPYSLTKSCKNFPKIGDGTKNGQSHKQPAAEPEPAASPEPEPTSSTASSLIAGIRTNSLKGKSKYGRALYARRSAAPTAEQFKRPQADVVETSVSYKVSSTNNQGRNKRQHRNDLLKRKIIKSAESARPEPEPTPEPKSEPEPEPEPKPEHTPTPEPEPKSEPEPEPEPTSNKIDSTTHKNQTKVNDKDDEKLDPFTPRHDFNPMDCTDIVIGTARGTFSRIGDYYTRDRSTPHIDSFWGGKDDLTAALAFEENGITTVLFRKPLKAKHQSDHSIENDLMHVIFAQGQEENNYIHVPKSGVEVGKASVKNFYKPDELKYHGHKTNRGTTTVNFYEIDDSSSGDGTRNGQNGSDTQQSSKIHTVSSGTETKKVNGRNECVGEWKYPKHCSIENYTCEYAVKWEFVTENDIKFVITTKQIDTWTGIGFSNDEKMPSTDAILGWVDKNGRHFLMDTSITGYTAPLVDKMQNIHNTTGQVIDGNMVLSFIRPRVSNDTKDISFEDYPCVYLMYPVKGGAFNGVNKKIRKHEAVPIVSSERICFHPCDGVLFGGGTSSKSDNTIAAYDLQVKITDLGSNFIVPSSGSLQYEDLSNSIRDNIQHIFNVVQGNRRLRVVHIEQEGEDLVASMNLQIERNNAEKSRALDTANAVATTEQVHKILQNSVGSGHIGNLKVDPTFLVFTPQSIISNIEDGGSSQENTFFTLSEAKLYIVLGCITALILVAILQASCTIYKTVSRGSTSQKDHLIPNSAWKDYSTTNTNYAFDRFDGTDEKHPPTVASNGNGTHQKVHHNHMVPSPATSNRTAAINTLGGTANHHQMRAHHQTRSTNNSKAHHHYQQPHQHRTNNAQNQYPIDTRSLQRGRNSAYASTNVDRSTFSLPRGNAYDRYNQQHHNDVQPDFYFMPSQRKYSGEVVRVYVDYNNQPSD